VGLCQWGAHGMAKKGFKKDEILKYYYPGAEIVTIDTLRDEQ
jgi:SpoIID/LytB domain protein